MTQNSQASDNVHVTHKKDLSSSEDQNYTEVRSNHINSRFTSEENRILFKVLKEDSDLLRSFMHRSKHRLWNGKSWMHEIGVRFNNVSNRFRTLDAVRHHFKLRYPTSARWNNLNKNGKHASPSEKIPNRMYLLEHAMSCQNCDTCVRCLHVGRMRVDKGLAKCGHENCKSCNTATPHVLQSFDNNELLILMMDETRRNGSVPNGSVPNGSCIKQRQRNWTNILESTSFGSTRNEKSNNTMSPTISDSKKQYLVDSSMFNHSDQRFLRSNQSRLFPRKDADLQSINQTNLLVELIKESKEKNARWIKSSRNIHDHVFGNDNVAPLTSFCHGPGASWQHSNNPFYNKLHNMGFLSTLMPMGLSFNPSTQPNDLKTPSLGNFLPSSAVSPGTDYSGKNDTKAVARPFSWSDVQSLIALGNANQSHCLFPNRDTSLIAMTTGDGARGGSAFSPARKKAKV